jgi:hypothetical protein
MEVTGRWTSSGTEDQPQLPWTAKQEQSLLKVSA